MSFNSYLGQSEATIDPNGRITVASKKSPWRTSLGDSFIICQGFDDYCLYIMDKDRFNDMSYQIAQMDFEDYIEISRDFHSFAFEVKADAQGRITLPPLLREVAEVDTGSKLILAGAGLHIEVREESKYREMLKEKRKQGMQALKSRLKFSGTHTPVQKDEV